MSDPVTAEKVFNPSERLALDIYQREASRNRKSLDDALAHLANWRRAIPEAVAILRDSGITDHIESQARRIDAMEKGIEQARQCYMDLAREHADYKRAAEPRAVHEREPPHCPTCECGEAKVGVDARSNRYDECGKVRDQVWAKEHREPQGIDYFIAGAEWERNALTKGAARTRVVERCAHGLERGECALCEADEDAQAMWERDRD